MSSNPFTNNQSTPQQLSWKYIPDETTHTIELIQPYKSIIMEAQHGRNTTYLALCIQDQTNNISPDKLSILHIPLQTFERAWKGTPLSFRQSIQPNDNVTLTLTKNTRKDIRIGDLQRTKPTQDQENFAKEQYSKIEQREETIKKQKEEREQ